MTGSKSEPLRLHLRLARRADSGGIARVYIDSWRETYAGILPVDTLVAMSHMRQTQNWDATIARQNPRNPVLVVVDEKENVYGFANGGPNMDNELPFEAELYTLYVAPGFTGQGIGSCLLKRCFNIFSRVGYRGAIIWALEGNPSRFFYESQGGSLVAERPNRAFGSQMREVGYGWPSLTPAMGTRT